MSGSKNHQENHVHDHINQDSNHGQFEHEHHNHSHEHCGHEHHNHSHGHENCNHNHSANGDALNKRYVFTEEEILAFQSASMEALMQNADDFLSTEEYGKVVPIFEIALTKAQESHPTSGEAVSDLMNLKQNLAFSYGIIGEHFNAIPLWKSVIEYEEKNGEDCSDLLDDYFGIALSCEQCDMEEEFLKYIQKGLKLAKENKFEDYVASFEHELGVYYCDHADYLKSELHYKNAIQIRSKLEDVVGLTMSKMNLGILYEVQKRYEDAKPLYDEALLLTKDEYFTAELGEERTELEFRLSQIQNMSLKSKLLTL